MKTLKQHSLKIFALTFLLLLAVAGFLFAQQQNAGAWFINAQGQGYTVPSTGTGSVVMSNGAVVNLTNATGTPANAGVMLDTGTIPIPLASLQTLNSVPLQIIPAPGATSMIQMGSCTLNLTFGSAAFTGGGTVSIGYGNTSTPATNGTIASTIFTTFAASHGVVVLPAAVAVTATTSLANKGIFMTAASADFAAGTGATGQIDCQYRILTGIQ